VVFSVAAVMSRPYGAGPARGLKIRVSTSG
jgi:hypothetical protein